MELRLETNDSYSYGSPRDMNSANSSFSTASSGDDPLTPHSHRSTPFEGGGGGGAGHVKGDGGGGGGGVAFESLYAYPGSVFNGFTTPASSASFSSCYSAGDAHDGSGGSQTYMPATPTGRLTVPSNGSPGDAADGANPGWKLVGPHGVDYNAMLQVNIASVDMASPHGAANMSSPAAVAAAAGHNGYHHHHGHHNLHHHGHHGVFANSPSPLSIPTPLRSSVSDQGDAGPPHSAGTANSSWSFHSGGRRSVGGDSPLAMFDSIKSEPDGHHLDHDHHRAGSISPWSIASPYNNPPPSTATSSSSGQHHHSHHNHHSHHHYHHQQRRLGLYMSDVQQKTSALHSVAQLPTTLLDHAAADAAACMLGQSLSSSRAGPLLPLIVADGSTLRSNAPTTTPPTCTPRSPTARDDDEGNDAKLAVQMHILHGGGQCSAIARRGPKARAGARRSLVLDDGTVVNPYISKVHEKGTHLCVYPGCDGHSFKRQEHCKRHIISKHLRTICLQCPFCEHSANRRDNYMQHLRLHATQGRKSKRCDYFPGAAALLEQETRRNGTRRSRQAKGSSGSAAFTSATATAAAAAAANGTDKREPAMDQMFVDNDEGADAKAESDMAKTYMQREDRPDHPFVAVNPRRGPGRPRKV